MSGVKNKIRAVFDVILTAESDSLTLDTNTNQEIDLRNLPENKEIMAEDLNSQEKSEESDMDGLMSYILEGDINKDARHGIEDMMSVTSDPAVELASMGVEVFNLPRKSKMPVSIKYHGRDLEKPELGDEFYDNIIQKIREPLFHKPVPAVAAAKVQSAPIFTESEPHYEIKVENKSAGQKVVDFYNNKPLSQKNNKIKNLNFHTPLKRRKTGLWFFALILTGAISYSAAVKNEITSGGVSAFNNLQKAEANLRDFNFSSAAEDFSRSYQDFSQMSENMSVMGAGLLGIFGDLPGTSKIKSAKNATEAGKLISQAGKAMSEAVSYLAQTGTVLNPNDENRIKPLKIINQIKNALALSSNNFQEAKALISDIDLSIIPEDKRQKFADFKDKLPLFEEYLGQAQEYTDFLEGIIGIDKSKKYLLLFENSSELRPTGGFPGTYGVVSFINGGLADFFVDDVYNLDGQLHKNIIPPSQLQHITPTWGMRDSAWFIDFPKSAKKASNFFAEEAGYGVDGVITLNPNIVSKILSVVGPIKMPQYNLILNENNFLSTIQEEVEYGDNRTQPKKVVVDFAPLFLEKLYSADSEKWMKIFNILMTGLGQKDILFYFNDRDLENFAIKEGFGGEVKNSDADYLTINISNIKGSKTDVVTDSSVSINTHFENGQAIHNVVITRDHNGGDHEHGFYNRQNPAYVRVLIPQDAELIDISGNDVTNYKPLVNYGLVSGFDKDPDLANFESTFYNTKFKGVSGFEESGKKGIGFWMVVDPGTEKKVEFEYSTPTSGDYEFYFQKQPGLNWKNLGILFDDPGGIKDISPGFNQIGNKYVWAGEINKDLDIKIKLK